MTTRDPLTESDDEQDENARLDLCKPSGMQLNTQPDTNGNNL